MALPPSDSSDMNHAMLAVFSVYLIVCLIVLNKIEIEIKENILEEVHADTELSEDQKGKKSFH